MDTTTPHPQEDAPSVKRGKGKRFEFAKLEQRPGTKEVHVPISPTELVKIADEVTTLAADIEDKEHQKSQVLPNAIKELKARQSVAVALYRDKKKPQLIDVVIGFDYDDKAPIVTSDFTNVRPGSDEEPVVNTQEFPYGKKWFLDVKTGAVYGPEAITIEETQKPMEFPETTVTGFSGTSVAEEVAEEDFACNTVTGCGKLIPPGDRVVKVGNAVHCAGCGEKRLEALKAEQEREVGARVTRFDSRRKKSRKGKKGDADDDEKAGK